MGEDVEVQTRDVFDPVGQVVLDPLPDSRETEGPDEEDDVLPPHLELVQDVYVPDLHRTVAPLRPGVVPEVSHHTKDVYGLLSFVTLGGPTVRAPRRDRPLLDPPDPSSGCSTETREG